MKILEALTNLKAWADRHQKILYASFLIGLAVVSTAIWALRNVSLTWTVIYSSFYDVGLVTPWSGLPWFAMLVIPIAGIVLNSRWMGVKPPLTFKSNMLTDTEKGFFTSITLTYFAWSVIQSFYVIGIYLLCQAFGLPHEVSATIAALAFGAIHSPNPLLIFACVAMSRIYLDHFHVYHNLWLIGFTHGLLGTFLGYYMPSAISTSFNIWGAYAAIQKRLQEKINS